MRDVQDKITRAKIDVKDALASAKLCSAVYDTIVDFIITAAQLKSSGKAKLEVILRIHSS